MSDENNVCIVARLPCPHLAASTDIFRHVLNEVGTSTWITNSLFAAIKHKGPVLFMQLEQYTLLGHVIALLRALMFRRTAAMVFRSKEALTGTKPQTRLKRLLLRIERHIPLISMLTIVPFDLLPNPDSLFSGWLHDTQLWDISLLPSPPADTGLADRARAAAQGRPIIAAMGLMVSYKGIDKLAELINDPAFCSQYYLVIAGEQIASVTSILANPAGDCLIENRHLSDGELYALYEAADYIWSVYDPAYDQASGIFGRALQFGRTPIVRSGSLIDQYAQLLDQETVAIDWNADPETITRALRSTSGKREPYQLDTASSFDALIRSVHGTRPVRQAIRHN